MSSNAESKNAFIRMMGGTGGDDSEAEVLGSKRPLEALQEALKSAEGIRTDTKSNDDFRTMMEEAESGVYQSKKLFQPTAVATNTLGTWEKHTKGIGMKLLNKFGFTGRLGAREDGVSRAIEVVVRPNGQGLGFGDFTESSALIVNKKLVAEWSGLEYKEEEVIEVKKVKKIITEQIAESKSWKKGKKDKQQVKTVSVSDFMDRKDEDKKSIIIDMRGEQTRVLTDYSEINTVPIEDQNLDPKIGQELLYNINLVVDLLEIDVSKESRKHSQDSKKVDIISNEIDLLEMQMERDAPRLKRLESVMQILNKISERQKVEGSSSVTNVNMYNQNRKKEKKEKRERKDQNSNGNSNEPYEIEEDEENDEDNEEEKGEDEDDEEEPPVTPVTTITLTAVSSLFQTLHSNFTEEFHIFGLIHLLPTVIYPVLSKLFSDWQPLAHPLKLADIHEGSIGLCDYFDRIKDHSLTAQTRSIIEETAQKVTLPAVRRVLTNDWNVHNPDQCVCLLEALATVYPASVVNEMIDMMVLPKIAAAVKAWSPTADTLPIHLWLHPWLPLMRSKLSVFYPEIRRKLGIALSSWQAINQSAISVVKPWREVFDKTSMDAFLIRVIVPKLVVALRNILINPQGQDITVFQGVIAWYNIIPHIHMVSLLRGEFFNRWLRVLINWLALTPDHMEVIEWYSGWKSSFPPGLLEDSDIMEPFNIALNLMNEALADSDDDDEEGGADGVGGGGGGDVGVGGVTGGGVGGGGVGGGKKQTDISSISETSYCVYIEKKLGEIKMRERLDVLNGDQRYSFSADGGVSSAHGLGAPTGRAGEISFKDVVESYAANSGITFIPKAGRVHEGKQIWLFGKSSCYLDRDVVFVYIAEQRWKAIALEELLKIS